MRGVILKRGRTPHGQLLPMNNACWRDNGKEKGAESKGEPGQPTPVRERLCQKKVGTRGGRFLEKVVELEPRPVERDGPDITKDGSLPTNLPESTRIVKKKKREKGGPPTLAPRLLHKKKGI